MKLDGRRESTNVEDRRGKGGAAKAGGLGIGGIIIVGLIWLLTGKAPDAEVVQQLTQGNNIEYTQTDPTQFSEEDQELFKFAKQILAGTEDVWTKEFKKWAEPTNLLNWWFSAMPSIRLVAMPHRPAGLSTAQATSAFTSTLSFSKA